MKALELFIKRRYAWFIYPLFFCSIASLLIFAISNGTNVPSIISFAFLLGSHDSLYCWKHGNHILPIADPLWMFYKWINKEEYYEKHYLIVGLIAGSVGTVLFFAGVIMLVANLPRSVV